MADGGRGLEHRSLSPEHMPRPSRMHFLVTPIEVFAVNVRLADGGERFPIPWKCIGVTRRHYTIEVLSCLFIMSILVVLLWLKQDIFWEVSFIMIEG